MGKFRLFDREKQGEEAAIRSIITALTSKFDRWVVGWNYGNGSPTPTADQASILEDEQIDLLLKEFDNMLGSIPAILSFVLYHHSSDLRSSGYHVRNCCFS
jgi:hypothetical protein